LNIAEKLSQPSAPFLEGLPGFHDGVQTWHKWRGDLLPKKCDDLEKRLAQGPVINVLTITLEGDANGRREITGCARENPGRLKN
jgi:hypothetical protein